jgi:hypothetical protein
MRRIILCALAPLVLGAPAASAAGINLGWNDCPSGATYSLLEAFACDTNLGSHTLVGSFVAPPGINAMSANEFWIDMATGSPLLASWWDFGTDQCRHTSLTANLDFTAGPFTCFDYWQAGGGGGFSWSNPFPGSNRGRIRGVFALNAGDPRITSVPEGLEVYSFKLNITNAKSTGLGACGGCTDEACIVLNELTLDQPAPNPPQIRLTNPAVSGHVVWQGWSTTDPKNQCPTITPARKQTWGSIKAMYR